jgi:hypothetical protein
MCMGFAEVPAFGITVDGLCWEKQICPPEIFVYLCG